MLELVVAMAVLAVGLMAIFNLTIRQSRQVSQAEQWCSGSPTFYIVEQTDTWMRRLGASAELCRRPSDKAWAPPVPNSTSYDVTLNSYRRTFDRQLASATVTLAAKSNGNGNGNGNNGNGNGNSGGNGNGAGDGNHGNGNGNGGGDGSNAGGNGNGNGGTGNSGEGLGNGGGDGSNAGGNGNGNGNGDGDDSNSKKPK